MKRRATFFVLCFTLVALGAGLAALAGSRKPDLNTFEVVMSGGQVDVKPDSLTVSAGTTVTFTAESNVKVKITTDALPGFIIRVDSEHPFQFIAEEEGRYTFKVEDDTGGMTAAPAVLIVE